MKLLIASWLFCCWLCLWSIYSFYDNFKSNLAFSCWSINIQIIEVLLDLISDHEVQDLRICGKSRTLGVCVTVQMWSYGDSRSFWARLLGFLKGNKWESWPTLVSKNPWNVNDRKNFTRRSGNLGFCAEINLKVINLSL